MEGLAGVGLMNVGQRIVQIVGGLLLAAIFAPLAWFFGIDPLAAAVGNWRQAADYVEVPATVETRTAQDAEGRFEYLVLRYERNGQSYETIRMTVLEDTDIDIRANAQVIERLRRPGANASVWVSPRRPEVALASRDLPWTSMWPRLPLAVGFNLLALAGLVAAARAAFGRNMSVTLWLTGFAGAWSGFSLPLFSLAAGEGTSVDTGATAGAGIFAVIGLGLTFVAVLGALRPSSETEAILASESAGGFRPEHRTTGGSVKAAQAVGSARAPAAPASGVKRGGIGRRGSGFDKR